MPFFMIIGILIFGYGAWIVRTGCIWLLARISGEQTRFYPLLSAVGYAYLPEMLGIIVVSSVLAVDPSRVSDLLIALPLFGLWSLALAVIGTRRVYGFRMRKSVLIGAIYLILVVGAYAGVIAIGNAFQQMMMG